MLSNPIVNTILNPMMNVTPAIAYLRYFVAELIFDNKINGKPKIPLAIVMPIILPKPNKIKKYIIVSKPLIVDAINATRLPVPAIP